MAMKRPASATSGKAKKFAKVTASKCAQVSAALLKTETLPESCRNMLATMMKDSLAIYVEERHPFQAQLVQMAAEAMTGIKAKLEDDIAKAKSEVGSADETKAARAQAAEAATGELTKLTEAAESAQATFSADTAAQKAAKASSADAASAVTAKEIELATAAEKKAKLENTMKDVYEPLKTRVAVPAETKALAKVFREFGLEGSLLDSLLDCLKNEVDARQTFDRLVLTEVEKYMTDKIAEIGKTIAEGDSATAALASAKAAAEKNLEDAVAKLAASKEALAAAEVAKVEGKAALTAAKSAVDSFEKDMEVAKKTLAQAEKAFALFVEGPTQAFQDLKDLAPPPPTPEPAPEEEVAELVAEAVAAEVAAAPAAVASVSADIGNVD